MSDRGLATEIASIIADFRQGEIVRRSAADVLEFAEQIQSVCQVWMNTQEKTLFLKLFGVDSFSISKVLEDQENLFS